jgi:hypothetical protein
MVRNVENRASIVAARRECNNAPHALCIRGVAVDRHAAEAACQAAWISWR